MLLVVRYFSTQNVTVQVNDSVTVKASDKYPREMND